ncbi:hypothetical protein BESB_013930 [Besnoitia besnoiti]|uniref:Uncharacterized protein n=1 Tax=Besnoitia besnoiti TaxID=94643 RepID=A0A2A9M8Y5_BESBE|nr:hypothetical protein BESB_013930 [Besnoitia besnoiti]PFH32781.1 hypothetical protein BESB_013930 [Besnoitia besnoiti]
MKGQSSLKAGSPRVAATPELGSVYWGSADVFVLSSLEYDAHPNVADPNVADPNVADPNVADPNVADPNVADLNVADLNVAGEPTLQQRTSSA